MTEKGVVLTTQRYKYEAPYAPLTMYTDIYIQIYIDGFKNKLTRTAPTNIQQQPTHGHQDQGPNLTAAQSEHRIRCMAAKGDTFARVNLRSWALLLSRCVKLTGRRAVCCMHCMPLEVFKYRKNIIIQKINFKLILLSGQLKLFTLESAV